MLINRSREEVFKFVATDYFENRQRWRPEVEYLEKTSEGAVGVGTTGYECYIDDASRQAEIHYVVTKYEPSKKFALRGTANAINEEGVREARTMGQPRTMDYQTVFTFSSSLGSTRLTIEYEYELALRSWHILMLPLYANSIKRRSVEGSNRLRNLLESEHESS